MNNNHNGFSLVELSIVLVIIGLLVGLGSSMIGPMMNFTKVRETRDMMDANLQAVISWASSNNKLPNVAGFTTTVAKHAKDTWNRDFIYLYDGNLYKAAPTKDTICGRRSTILTLETIDNTTTTSTVSNVAFAVLSDADNATLKSTLIVNGPTELDFTSRDATSGYTSSKITVKGPNGYLVRWVTLDELRSKIGCQGAPLKILNNELPFGSKSTSGYSATITADGGVPSSYKWCIEAAAISPALTIPPIIPGLTFQTPLYWTTPTTPGNNCSETVNTWVSGSTLTISGNPTTPGSYSFTVYVGDSDSNTAQKSFVITVNP